MCYNAPMTNDSYQYDDDLDDMTDDEAIAMLIDDGYTVDEAKRMVGIYDPDDDEYCFGGDDLDRDIPDFVDDEDFD